MLADYDSQIIPYVCNVMYNNIYYREIRIPLSMEQ